ncbi:MAG TPA: hypothetical protein DEA08_28725 [Planctomycetes bacterium]|nr:hypothetical protein [Planctomycetota bacterium]
MPAPEYDLDDLIRYEKGQMLFVAGLLIVAVVVTALGKLGGERPQAASPPPLLSPASPVSSGASK